MIDKNVQTLAARQLKVVLDTLGEVAEIRDGSVELPSVGMRASIVEVELRDRACVVVYDLGSTQGVGTGIQVLAVGYGDNHEQALGAAALQWANGVFSVVRHWLAPSEHTCLVDDMEMLVRGEGTAEEFAWRIHIGPVLSRYWNSGGAEIPAPPENLEIIRVLFDHVHGYAAHRTLFWVEAFAARHSDGDVDATCRLHNEDWAEGRDALVAWARGWPASGAQMTSARQFFLFEPLDPLELRDRQLVAKTIERGVERKRPWWRLVWPGGAAARRGSVA